MAKYHPHRILLLTGAPNVNELDFRSLQEPYDINLPTFLRFLNQSDVQSQCESTRLGAINLSKVQAGQWRFVDFVRELKRLDDSNNQEKGDDFISSRITLTTSYSSIANMTCTSEDDTSIYLEQSLILHEMPQVSEEVSIKCINSPKSSTIVSIYQTPIKDLISSNEEISKHEDMSCVMHAGCEFHLTRLADIPSSEEIHKLAPQTVTVSLLVVVIKLNIRFKIQVRRSGQLMDLTEVVVGDDTRSAFNVNIWLPSLRNEEQTDFFTSGNDTRSILHSLKLGDIILVQNAALAAWRGRAYAQNLHRKIGSVATQVNKLQGNCYSLPKYSNIMDRASKVQEWAMMYTPEHSFQHQYSHKMAKESLILPPDTQ